MLTACGSLTHVAHWVSQFLKVYEGGDNDQGLFVTQKIKQGTRIMSARPVELYIQ